METKTVSLIIHIHPRDFDFVQIRKLLSILIPHLPHPPLLVMSDRAAVNHIVDAEGIKELDEEEVRLVPGEFRVPAMYLTPMELCWEDKRDPEEGGPEDDSERRGCTGLFYAVFSPQSVQY